MDQTSDEITIHFNRDIVCRKDGPQLIYGLINPARGETLKEPQPDAIGQLLLRRPEQLLAIIVFLQGCLAGKTNYFGHWLRSLSLIM